MKKLSILALSLLTSCSAMQKHKEDFKTISHDIIDDEIDELDKVEQSQGDKPTEKPTEKKNEKK